MPAKTLVSCMAPRAMLGAHHLVVATPKIIAPPCRRPAATLLLATNGKPFRISLADAPLVMASAVLIGPRQKRVLHADGCDLLSINIEPGHADFLPILSRLDCAPALVFSDRHFSALLPEMRALYESTGPGPGADAALATLLDAGSSRARALRRDPRIELVLQCVHAELPGRIALPVLAGLAGLSEDRLSHLFVAVIGMPLRSYVVWQRYKMAVRNISRTSGLAALASNCGFSDAAHMTRTFVDFFGLSPSALLRSGFIQDGAP